MAALLEEIADLLEIKGENRFRTGAYREAARQVASHPQDVAVLADAARLEEIPHVGTSIAAKISEYLSTGHLAYLDDLHAEVPRGLVAILGVPGLGPAKARLVYSKLGIDTIDALAEAARAQRLRHLPGMGEKTEEKILRELERLQQRTKRLPLGVVLPAAEEIVSVLSRHPAVQRIDPAGSIRRMRDMVGDIDLLVASGEPAAVIGAFAGLPMIKEVVAQGSTKATVLARNDLQIDLRVIAPREYGSALQYFTGSKEHNVALREIAIAQHYKLSEYGLFDIDSERRVAGETEEAIYQQLGLAWIPPELREQRGELEAAAVGRLPVLVSQADIRGDLHVHSEWSDGSVTIEQMANTARDLGYEYLAITDHSKTLGVARGLTVERVHEQRREIERLNEVLAPFRILAGTEVEILTDGRIDYDDRLLRQFDLVGVSVHSAFGQPKEVMTARVVAALRNPHVHIFNHPTGRLLGKREPYELDLGEVLRVAAEEGKALELNAAPDRLDLDDFWTRRAKDAGIKIAISTDAHRPSELSWMRYGIAAGRRAWLERSHVLNALPLTELLDILGRRRS